MASSPSATPTDKDNANGTGVCGASASQGGSYNGSMSSYCKSLETWLGTSYWHREAAVSAYYSALSMIYPQNQFTSASTTGNNNNVPPAFNISFSPMMQQAAQQAQAQQQQQQQGNLPQRPQIIRQILIRGIRVNGTPVGIDLNVAPAWKRLVAELIDFAILLIIKLFITVSIIDAFEIFDLDDIDMEQLGDSDALFELAKSMSVYQLILLELVHRIMVCFFEAYCLYKGGATPGKNMMALRVLYCDTIFPIGPNINNNQEYLYNNGGGGGGTRVVVAPGTLLSFKRAFLRSLIKNFSLAFFFPFCFTLFHFEYSRTLYDLAAKSIVIEIQRNNLNN